MVCKIRDVRFLIEEFKYVRFLIEEFKYTNLIVISALWSMYW